MDRGLTAPGNGERGFGLDLDGVDLGFALAALSDVGFTGVVQEGIEVRPVEHDAAAVRFDPV